MVSKPQIEFANAEAEDDDDDEDEIDKRKRNVKLHPHPITKAKDPTVYPIPSLDGLPDDFDVDVHKSFRKKDFANEALYWEYKAMILEEEAKEYRETAEEIRSGDTSRSAIRKLKKFAKSSNTIMQALLAGGKYTPEELQAILAEQIKALSPQS